MAGFDMRIVRRPKAARDNRQTECSSDCWPDWADGGDPASVEECASKNAPAVVFGEIGRVLLAVLAAIAAIQIALNVLHIS